jgi:hypothetical protein
VVKNDGIDDGSHHGHFRAFPNVAASYIELGRPSSYYLVKKQTGMASRAYMVTSACDLLTTSIEFVKMRCRSAFLGDSPARVQMVWPGHSGRSEETEPRARE